jgi:arylsulfatase A-like enzyme
VQPASEVDPLPAAQLRHDYSTDHFPGHAAWLDGQWKLHRIEPKAGGEPKWELYDLNSDRSETRNQISAEPARVARMKTELDAWLSSVANSLNGTER